MKQKSLIFFLLIITSSKLSNAIIKVNFELDTFNQYKATIAGQDYSYEEKGTKVVGKHEAGRKSSDVKVIDFADKDNNFTGYPPMLSSIFSQAEVILAQNSGLKRLDADSFIHATKVTLMMFEKDNFIIEPAAFRYCVSLEVLKFGNMNLSEINSEAFEEIPQLQILAMKNCELTRIDDELLAPLENLIELHITENPMTKPPISAIQHMTRLKVLNLSGNKLTHVHDDLFKNKNFLESVDVSYNQIHEIERDILLHWPGHAMINMEGNVCIDKSFSHIGTDSLTVSDVANALMPCFKEESFITEEEEESSETYEQSDEKSPNVEKEIIKEVTTQKLNRSFEMIGSKSSESTERRKKILLEKLMKGKESSSEEEKIEKEVIAHERDASEILETNANKFESESNESETSSSEEKPPKEIEGKIPERSDVETVIPSKKSSESEEESSEESIEEAPKDQNNEKDHEGLLKDEEVIATISPYQFMEEEESAAAIEEISPKLDEIEEIGGDENSTKKKKGKKGKKLNSTVENFTEVAVEMPEPVSSFLHPYEQAWCRFFIDADNKYNCVLENCTSEVKLINTDHLSGYNNSLVSGLYLRKCVLAKLSVVFFTTFPNLEHMSVEDANIKQLDEDTVKDGCGSLKTLSLKNNKIRRLERHALQPCQHLELVDLTGNPMEMIEGDIANYNPKLSILMGGLKIVSPAITSFNIDE